MSQRIVGRRAEEIAAEYLQGQGYKIVARNVYVGRWGEIDLIAYEDEVLVFVEVKARSSLRFGLPEEALTQRKRRQLVQAARAYRQQHALAEVPCRFDVIAVELWHAPPQLRHYKDAFGSEEVL
ncbi:MAG: YraN family protein [Candidatus Kapabacteria bacterium]|nr:YraN family protein [Candidatus Kapabacteria bacterium]MDW8011609.1 YraN family protein [Bacteroidota bacterium]